MCGYCEYGGYWFVVGSFFGNRPVVSVSKMSARLRNLDTDTEWVDTEWLLDTEWVDTEWVDTEWLLDIILLVILLVDCIGYIILVFRFQFYEHLLLLCVQ